MKKAKKVLLALLSVLTVASLSVGLASCEWLGKPVEVPTLPPIQMPSFGNPSVDNSSSQEEDSEFRQVYAMYVEYAQEQGTTPLSYEMWLMSIRGEKGDQVAKVTSGGEFVRL